MKSGHHIPKDERAPLWTILEKKIQARARKKDKKFTVKGKWKKFLRKTQRFTIFKVDGEWVRNNLSVIFEHGGHGYVHEFIPLNEIWVATHHPKECPCRKVRGDRKISMRYFESTILHEITECEEMAKGKSYWEAHNCAMERERKAGLLKDSYEEYYE